MAENLQVAPQSSLSDLSNQIQSLSLTDQSFSLPAKTREAIETSLKYGDRKALVKEYFLQSLAFITMDDREEEITAAHKATFDWIFDKSDAEKAGSESGTSGNLMSWLRKHDGRNVYWINGRAGSGKSTFMRYVYEHPETTEQLKVWAGDKPLLCPRFFFWTSGTVDQKSAVGLLRSLLHQLFLTGLDDLIPWTFPELWLKYQDTKTRIREPIQWSAETLQAGLERLLGISGGKVKICFFIDGLDELEGNQQALVEMLQSMVPPSSEDFKACVSSRPWKVFEAAFTDIPQLKLQDLTKSDIWRYVNDSLGAAHELQPILKDDHETMEKLNTKISESADGVFLWATLAVKYLVNHTLSTHTTADLFQTLTALPTTLDDLFRYLLLDTKTTFELEQQSRLLQIIHAREIVCEFTRHESSNVVILYQMVLAIGDKSYDMTDTPSKQPDNQILEQCRSMKQLILDRCAGLLRVHQNRRKPENTQGPGIHPEELDDANVQTVARDRIGYLHRTVRDFFWYSGGFEEVSIRTAGAEFDPHLGLLRSHVLQLKFPLETPKKHRVLDDWWPDVVLAMTHARYAGPEFDVEMVELLNHFKSTLDWYWIPKRMDPLDNWARNAFATYEQRMKHRTPYHYPFLSLATKFGVSQYVRAELETGNYSYQGGIPLLSHAVELLASRRHSVYPLSNPELIAMLLERDESPNLLYKTLANKDETPWLLTLKYVREANRRGWIEEEEIDEGIQRWTKTVESFLHNGADPNALIVKDNWDPAATALDIFTMLGKKYNSPAIGEILNLLIAKGSTLHAGGE